MFSISHRASFAIAYSLSRHSLMICQAERPSVSPFWMARIFFYSPIMISLDKIYNL